MSIQETVALIQQSNEYETIETIYNCELPDSDQLRDIVKSYYLNTLKYETYEQAKQETEGTKQQITHSQFMKLAWELAKNLAGGSKGSRAKLSQAMKHLNQEYIH